jgi:heptosyltransferase I
LIAGPESNPKLERILIVRLGAMGDVIHALPAVQALGRGFREAGPPQITIGWLIERRWMELLCAPAAPLRGPRSEARPLVDWIHTVNLRAWRKSLFTLPTIQQIARVRNDVRSAHYDAAIDLQGAIRSAILARCSGARAVWGAADPWESPASMGYTRIAITRGPHVIEQNLSIAEAVAQARSSGSFAAREIVQFPRDPAAEDRVDRMLAEIGARDFAVLNPGAGWGAKRWPPQRYGLVARALASEGVQSIINHGPGEEELASQAHATSAGAAKPWKSSISELIALMRRAKLFIGGDTGPLHLAAALRVPVVAIFGPTDPARNGPYGTRSIVLRNPASRTTHARGSQPDEGLLDISAENVVRAACQLLHESVMEQPHG